MTQNALHNPGTLHQPGEVAGTPLPLSQLWPCKQLLMFVDSALHFAPSFAFAAQLCPPLLSLLSNDLCIPGSCPRHKQCCVRVLHNQKDTSNSGDYAVHSMLTECVKAMTANSLKSCPACLQFPCHAVIVTVVSISGRVGSCHRL